jgi:hypothetical protein
VNKGFKLHPPCQKKREEGRLRKNRFKPARETGGKATRQVRCPNCQEYGHRASSWKYSLTGTKKKRLLCSFMSVVNLHSFVILKSCHIIYRKRTKKTNVKVGRKKAKKATGGDEAIGTLRIRGALTREAATKVKREAAATELKVTTAREAATKVAIEAAAREEAEAEAQQEVMEVMALEVHIPKTYITARRYCCSLIC